MVAVASATLREPTRPSDRRWIVGGVGIVVLAAAVTLITGAGEPGRTTLALLVALVGGAVWAGVYSLFGGRAACWAALATVLLLSTAGLPVRRAAEYEWAQALYATDQEGKATEAVDAVSSNAPALRVLAEAIFPGTRAPYALQSEIGGQATTWNCPFAHGRQWLILPLSPGALAGSSQVPVTFKVAGQPNRDNAYLVLFGSFRLPGVYVLSFGDPTSPDGLAATLCQPA